MQFYNQQRPETLVIFDKSYRNSFICRICVYLAINHCRLAIYFISSMTSESERMLKEFKMTVATAEAV